MKSNSSIKGNCAICGKYKKLTFEHVPPQSAFNNKPIYMQHHEHLFDEGSYLYGKKKRSSKGFGGYTLCEPCNNNTGDWYARDFGDFVHQGMNIIKSIKEPQYFIAGNYSIKPLNVLKQIVTMFMSADKMGHLRSQNDLVDFILNKECQILPERFKIYLYSTLSSFKRMIGYSLVYDPILGVQNWSEINFQPFGYLLAEDSKPAHKDMIDISIFSQFKYNEHKEVVLVTSYLNVDSPVIGLYS